MVTNNIELDVKVKCLEANMTQQQVGEAIGTTGQQNHQEERWSRKQDFR